MVLRTFSVVHNIMLCVLVAWTTFWYSMSKPSPGRFMCAFYSFVASKKLGFLSVLLPKLANHSFSCCVVNGPNMTRL